MSVVAPDRPSGRRWWIIISIVAGLALLVGANAHFLYVAFSSQPDCVQHLKAPGESGSFRAAKSAC